MTAEDENRHMSLLVLIDFQMSFMEQGELAVSGSLEDARRAVAFGRRNAGKISRIAFSLDTHLPRQIFFPGWWTDANGKAPEPFTLITALDVNEGKWVARYQPEKSKTYTAKLQEAGKILTVWPYHCLQGTRGASLEPHVSEFIYSHAEAHQLDPYVLVKGLDPLSEMYGIIRPEYDELGYVNSGFLAELEKYGSIVIAGEAASHCVLESVTQIAEHFRDRRDVTERIFLLQDCMSPISGYEEATKRSFQSLAERYGIRLVNSTDLTL